MSWWDKYVHKYETPWTQSKSTNLPPWKCFQYDISAFIEMSEFVWQTRTRHKHETPEARLRPQDLPCQLTGTPFSPLNLSPKSQLQIFKISPSKVCFNFINMCWHHEWRSVTNPSTCTQLVPIQIVSKWPINAGLHTPDPVSMRLCCTLSAKSGHYLWKRACPRNDMSAVHFRAAHQYSSCR